MQQDIFDVVTADMNVTLSADIHIAKTEVLVGTAKVNSKSCEWRNCTMYDKTAYMYSQKEQDKHSYVF